MVHVFGVDVVIQLGEVPICKSQKGVTCWYLDSYRGYISVRFGSGLGPNDDGLSLGTIGTEIHRGLIGPTKKLTRSRVYCECCERTLSRFTVYWSTKAAADGDNFAGTKIGCVP